MSDTDRSVRGIFAKPVAATSVTAAKKLCERRTIDKDDTVVCDLTGHVLKQPDAIRFEEEEYPDQGDA